MTALLERPQVRRTRAHAPRRPRWLLSPRVRRGIIGVVALAAIMEIVSRSGVVNPAFLPPFSEVLVAAAALLGRADFLNDLAATVGAYGLGLAISAAIAVPLGVLFGLARPIYLSSRTILEVLRPLPPIVFIPLVLLAVGSGLEMKLIVVIFSAVFPIMFNTMYGVHDVEPVAKDMARTFGLSPLSVVRRVVIPSAAPFMMTGIRIASSIVLIVVITVEMLAGGTEGIGAFIARARAAEDRVPDVYAGTLMAGVVGLTINLGIGWIERRHFGWQSAKEATES